jgi:hypothetical protein
VNCTKNCEWKEASKDNNKEGCEKAQKWKVILLPEEAKVIHDGSQEKFGRY